MDAQRNDEVLLRQVKRKPIPSRQATADAIMDHSLYPSESSNWPLLRVRHGSPDDVKPPMHSVEDEYDEIAADGDTSRRGGSSSTLQAEKATSTQPGSEPEASKRKSSVTRIIRGWWQEAICCVLSIAALVALIIVLRISDGKPLPKWSSGITINTVIAFLSTIARASFLIPVTEGLSQCKRNWFKQKPRPLKDFDIFDQASRGPLGGLSLLVRTKGRLVGIVSAILLITSTATATLTQSVVTYPSRKVPIEAEGKAVAWRLQHWFRFISNAVAIRETKATLAAGIVQAAYVPLTEVIPFKEPVCQEANCTWPEFNTLSVCHHVTNVTHLFEATKTELEPFVTQTTVALPNGVNFTANSSYGDLVIAPGPSLSYNGTQIQNTSITNYFILSSFLSTPRAVEVALHWCVNTYKPVVENNVLSNELVMSHTELHNGTAPVPNPINPSQTYLIIPADKDTKYVGGGDGSRSMGQVLDTVLTSSSNEANLEKFRTPTDVLFQDFFGKVRTSINGDKYDEIFGRGWWNAINNMAQNIANGITNTIHRESERSGVQLVNSTAWQREVFVEVRWPALPQVQVTWQAIQANRPS